MIRKTATLALCVLFVALPLTLTGCTRTPPQPVIFTDLITACERNSNPTIEFTSEFMDYLATRESYFTTLRFNAANNYKNWLPRIYKRTINLTAQTVSHEIIPVIRLRWADNEHVMIERHNQPDPGMMYPTNINNPSINEIIVITATDKFGIAIPAVATRIRVVRVPVPVTSVLLQRAGGGSNYFPIETNIVLQAITSPDNASFRMSNFIIKRVVANEVIITGDDISQFVVIHNELGNLFTIQATNLMNPDDTIDIIAITQVDGIKSNLLTLTVI